MQPANLGCMSIARLYTLASLVDGEATTICNKKHPQKFMASSALPTSQGRQTGPALLTSQARLARSRLRQPTKTSTVLVRLQDYRQRLRAVNFN